MPHPVLAARTDFSLGESILTIDTLIREAQALGVATVGITDTMSLTAIIQFTKAAQKAKLRPIVGTRLRLSDDPTWRVGPGEKKKDGPRQVYLTAYPRTEEGLKALYRLLSLANTPDRFYYVPQLAWGDLYAELAAVGPEALALHLGDAQSALEHPDLSTHVAALKGLCSALYAPLVPIQTPYYGRLNEIALDLCVQEGLEPLVIRPAFYERGQADAQEIMAGVATNTRVADGWFPSRHVRDMHMMDLRELAAAAKGMSEHLEKRGRAGTGAFWAMGLRNTDTLVDQIGYTWEKQPVSLPTMAPNEFETVVRECQAGWKRRFEGGPVFGHQPTLQALQDVYKPRLAYELTVLRDLKFSGYFLLVQDIVRYAKSNGILVGPGRGSVGGSLVAYLMGITECDPIRFDLLFERFINPERIDLPDADLDFMSERRGEIIDYLIAKYGTEHVSGVANFSTLGAASALREIGKALGVPERDYAVSKFVPKKHGQSVTLPEARDQVKEIDTFALQYPDVWTVMVRLEGTIRNFATHAAGVVVGGVPLTDRGVVERRKDGAVICFDKTLVEDQGLVKVDILGLTTLDLIALTLDTIRQTRPSVPDIGAIPLDDAAVLRAFAEARTTGIFQFESGGMRRLLKELGRDGITFEDITAATALYRPGPMESGMMDSFFLRKQGREIIDYDHDLMKPILEETFGVIVYQEQVMKISQAIAGYTGPQADKLRKIMGKKLPEEMKKERSKFVEGCVKTIQCDEEWAGALFDKIEGFAGYGFNKSHSVEYTLISYQAMWLKTHFPAEFFVAALSLMDVDKLPGLLTDARRHGLTVETPNINVSTDRFVITGTTLTMPFQRVKGISSITTQAILEARKSGRFASIADLSARVERRKCNVRHIDNLDRVGAFAWVEPGQVPPNHPSRIKDQIELLPGLIDAHVPVERDLHIDTLTRNAITDVVQDYRAAHGASGGRDGLAVRPHFGKAAKLVIVTDSPAGDDEAAGSVGYSRSVSSIVEAMAEIGLEHADVYWTTLIKRCKAGKQVTAEEIALYKPYLDRELEILKPPILVLMGSQTVKHFLPDLKGKASDHAGKVVYDKDRDANLVVGFNPGEIYFAPEKQEDMNKVLEVANALVRW